MKQVEKVWAAISAHKENLSTHKVELSLVGDMNDFISENKGAAKDLQDDVTVARDLEDRLADVTDEIRTKTNQLEDASIKGGQLLQRFETAAKNLGIDPRDNQSYVELENIIEDINGSVNIGSEY